MRKLDNNKGSALAFTTMVVLILTIIIPPFYSLALSHYNVAAIDSLRQQAYYNAHSGVEYARFIINNPATYDPTKPSGPPNAWPKTNEFQCVGNEVVRVDIGQRADGSFDITSTGTDRNTGTTAVVIANYIAGVIKSWSR